MSYPKSGFNVILKGEVYPSADMQSVYSTTPADWANSGNKFPQFSKLGIV